MWQAGGVESGTLAAASTTVGAAAAGSATATTCIPPATMLRTATITCRFRAGSPRAGRAAGSHGPAAVLDGEQHPAPGLHAPLAAAPPPREARTGAIAHATIAISRMVEAAAKRPVFIDPLCRKKQPFIL